jgi:type IV pilus assembly protein PilC
MTYPVISLVMVIGISLFLMIGIVPQFRPIFDSLGIKLPALTAAVMNTSQWLVHNYLIGAGIAAAFITGLVIFKRSEVGATTVDWTVLHLPVFGTLFQKVALSRFSRTFSTLLRSGVPILGSLEIVAETSGNRIISRAVLKARDSVKNGNSLSEPLETAPVFPAMVTRMIAIGEKSGSLEQLLEKISTFYDEQVSAAVKSLTSMIEPLLIGLMGGLVGTIVFAVFLPIFEIQKKLSGGH